MQDVLYVMMIERGKTYNKLNKEGVIRHVDNLRRLDDEGKLVLCGAFRGYPGVAGMVILRANSFEEADEICKKEPLVVDGYATYKLRVLHQGNKENNFLL